MATQGYRRPARASRHIARLSPSGKPKGVREMAAPLRDLLATVCRPRCADDHRWWITIAALKLMRRA